MRPLTHTQGILAGKKTTHAHPKEEPRGGGATGNLAIFAGLATALAVRPQAGQWHTNRSLTVAVRMFVCGILFISCGIALAAPSSAEGGRSGASEHSEANIHVRAVRIDETTVTGLWIGSADGTSVELRTLQGGEVIPIDDLMYVSLLPEQRLKASAELQSPEDLHGLKPAARSSTIFYLADGGRMTGEVIEPTGARRPDQSDGAVDVVTARTPLSEATVMPFERLAGIQFVQSEDHPLAAESFQKTLSERLPGFDVLVTRGSEESTEGKATQRTLRGRLERLGRNQGRFAFGGRVRTFQVDKAFGIVLAGGAVEQPTYKMTFELAGQGGAPRLKARAESQSPESPRGLKPAAHSAGAVVSGMLRSATVDTLFIETSIGIDAELPLAAIASIRFRSNRVVYISDLSPTAQRVEGRLHRPWPIRRDLSVSGGALRLNGRHFHKGIGVHSRTELDYELAGVFETFVATIGIDDAVRPRGSVIFRVIGDGRELYVSPMSTGLDEPLTCRANIFGVNVLTLIVDYGDSLDLSDHADWGGARLIREPPQTEELGRTR